MRARTAIHEITHISAYVVRPVNNSQILNVISAYAYISDEQILGEGVRKHREF